MIVTMVMDICGMYLSLGHVYKPISPNISSYIYVCSGGKNAIHEWADFRWSYFLDFQL